MGHLPSVGQPCLGFCSGFLLWARSRLDPQECLWEPWRSLRGLNPQVIPCCSSWQMMILISASHEWSLIICCMTWAGVSVCSCVTVTKTDTSNILRDVGLSTWIDKNIPIGWDLQAWDCPSAELRTVSCSSWAVSLSGMDLSPGDSRYCPQIGAHPEVIPGMFQHSGGYGIGLPTGRP